MALSVLFEEEAAHLRRQQREWRRSPDAERVLDDGDPEEAVYLEVEEP